MLRLERVEARQGGFALEADFSLPEGSRAAVLGPSGGGKSTLLAVIAGFLAPLRGRVLWQGRDLAPLPPGQRPVSILFQDHNLFPHLTVFENVALGHDPRLRLDAHARSGVEAALERVGLAGMGARRPAELSGGQMGRAALARVLMRARPVMLLDEPFAALGPGLKAEMLQLVREIVEETFATLLLVTHDPEDARALEGVTLFVDAGGVSPPEDTGAMFADPPAALRAYLGQRA